MLQGSGSTALDPADRPVVQARDLELHDEAGRVDHVEDMERLRGGVDLAIGQQIHGSIGAVDPGFEGCFNRFRNLVKLWPRNRGDQASCLRLLRTTPSPPTANPSSQADAGSGTGAGACSAARTSYRSPSAVPSANPVQ